MISCGETQSLKKCGDGARNTRQNSIMIFKRSVAICAKGKRRALGRLCHCRRSECKRDHWRVLQLHNSNYVNFWALTDMTATANHRLNPTTRVSLGVEAVEKGRPKNLQEKRPPYLAFKRRSRIGVPSSAGPTSSEKSMRQILSLAPRSWTPSADG